MRIRTKITLSVIPIIVIGLTLLTCFSVYIYQKHLKALVYDDLDDISNAQKYLLLEIIDRVRSDFKELTRNSNLTISLSEYNNNASANALSKINDSLNNELVISESRKTINIVNLSGKIIASTDKLKIGTPYTYFPMKAIENKVKIDLLDVKNNDVTIKIAGPIVMDGKVIGILDLNVPDSNLAKSLINVHPGIRESGKNVLVKNLIREEKFQLLHFNKNAAGVIRVNQDTIDQEDYNFQFLKNLLSGVSNSFISYHGQESLASVKEIPGLEWSVVSMIDKSEAYQEIYNIVAYTVLALFFIAIMVTYILHFVAIAITKPLNHLADVFEHYQDNGVIQEIPIEGGEETKILATVLKNTVQQLQDQLENDLLTGLPNRRFISHYLLKVLDSARGNSNAKIAIFFMKIEGIDTINETLGHEYGDKLLQEIAGRFKHFVDEGIIVAKFEGDQFVAVINKYSDEDGLAAIANIMINIFIQPFMIEKRLYKLKVNIGISQYPLDALLSQDLFQYADIASLYALKDGLNTYKFYDKEIGDQWQHSQWMKSELYKAIHENQLEMYYQPQIDTNLNKIIGVEALMRWNHATAGFISPIEFIDLAEKNNMIQELTEIAISHSCKAFETLRASGVHLEKMSINLSARDFDRQDLIKYLLENIQKFSIPAHNITLEITESLLMTDTMWIMSIITQLKSLGFRISLDDFGKGFSSLSILYQLPIDIIKLDKAFVDELSNNKQCQDIALTILDLGKRLNKIVLAEGVETLEQLQWLRDQGCHLFQGYYFAKPMPLDELIDFYKTFPKK